MLFSKKQAKEIRDLVTLGQEDEWEEIEKSLLGVRTKYQNGQYGQSAGLFKEFDAAVTPVCETIDQRLERFLELCKSRSVRPDLMIEPTIQGLEELVKQLQKYGDQRATNKGRLGQTHLIVGHSDKAVAAAKKHLERGRILALQGLANGRLIFPQTAWPKRWWQRILGFVGTILSFVFRLFIRSSGSAN